MAMFRSTAPCWLVLGLCAVLSSVDSTSFVQRRGMQLTVDGNPWYFIGANAYWLMDFGGNHAKIDSFFQRCNDWGLQVIRLWGFNHNSPSARGVYSEFEMQGFDYIVDSARRHNVRLIFALGNIWGAYRSAEDYMRMAGDDPSGKDLFSFYQSQLTKEFFKDHIKHMVTRQNVYNGQTMYKDDPTIMMWDVFNEPRCPGCAVDWMQQVLHSWLNEMAWYLKGQAPNQLVAAGTEGYFMDDGNVRWNPGAGAYCEGENWVSMNSLSGLEVTTAHIYDRQMENVPPSWHSPTTDDLYNWLQKYLEAHERAARSLGKPFLVEEFNIIFPKYSESQRVVYFRIIYDFLINQKQTGGPMCGALFWNAAIGGDVWDDGYNIYLDVSRRSSRRMLQDASSLHTSGASAHSNGTTTTAEPLVTALDGGRAPIHASSEGLNAFRRGPQRSQCAEEAAKWWKPLWGEKEQRTVDTGDLFKRTSGKRTVDVIKDTAWALSH